MRAAARAAPTVGNGPGVLVRQTQAQKWSRTRSNFPQTQGPVARREFRHPLRFCAPEGFCLAQEVTPVMESGADAPCQGEMSRSDRGGRVAVLWT